MRTLPRPRNQTQKLRKNGEDVNENFARRLFLQILLLLPVEDDKFPFLGFVVKSISTTITKKIDFLTFRDEPQNQRIRLTLVGSS